MLTGLQSATAGDAYVCGKNITSSKSKVDSDDAQGLIGVCPQFDLLFAELTVREHLLFFARLHGIPEAQEDALVDKVARSLGLGDSHLHKRSCALSGGMQRRLSLAIALLGDPPVVFLDEPTTVCLLESCTDPITQVTFD